MSEKLSIDLENQNEYAFNANEIAYKSKGSLSGVAYAVLRTKGHYQENNLVIAPCCKLELK